MIVQERLHPLRLLLLPRRLVINLGPIACRAERCIALVLHGMSSATEFLGGASSR